MNLSWNTILCCSTNIVVGSKTITEKINLISGIQIKISQDSKATLNDIEIFYNTTEILKGSLSLWYNENSMNEVKQSISGIYYAKPITKWSFWAKLGFVAGADALGGRKQGDISWRCCYCYGVPMYVPSGPTGTVTGALESIIIYCNKNGRLVNYKQNIYEK